MTVQPGIVRSRNGHARVAVDVGARRAASSLVDEMAELRSRVARQEADLAELRRQVGVMRRGLSNRQDALEIACCEGTGVTGRREYLRTTQRLRRMVERVVPTGGVVAVAGKGLDDLTPTLACRAEHLGRSRDGGYPSFHPSCGRAAIAQVEDARWNGATHLLVPAAVLWWMEHYVDLARYLERRYVLLEWDNDAGAIWSLQDRSPWREVEEVLQECSAGSGRTPAVLDWHTGSGLTVTFPDVSVFAPVDENDILPYVDHSIDVVAVRDTSEWRLAEARRVAGVAVLLVSGGPERVDASVIWRASQEEPCLPPVSLIVFSADGGPTSSGYPALLADTLPGAFEGEILRVSDRSHSTLLMAAQAASHDLLVFVDTSVRPVPGWLPPLVRVLAEEKDAGVSCAMLLEPDGRLVEAGGRLPEESAAGPGEYVITAPKYSHVREVDCCSSLLMATHRDLFLAAGGFHPEADPFTEGPRYCAEAQARGRRVVYQPDAVGVVARHG